MLGLDGSQCYVDGQARPVMTVTRSNEMFKRGNMFIPLSGRPNDVVLVHGRGRKISFQGTYKVLDTPWNFVDDEEEVNIKL